MKSVYTQLDDIKKDIKTISKNMTTTLSAKAEKDLVKAHELIIDKFYASHTPSSYHRHGIGGLYYSLTSHSNKNNTAYIKVGYSSMEEHYRTSAENVFDLMWNAGVRGLPEKGFRPLKHTFFYVDNIGRLVNYGKKGQVWENPYWSGEGDPYHNLFRTNITIDKLTTETGTPHDVMYSFVDKWGNDIGSEELDKLVKKIPLKHK